MRRAAPPILLCLLLASCDKEPSAGRTAATRTGQEAVPGKPPVLPTTGGPVIRKDRLDLALEIDRAEKDLESGTKPPAHLAYAWKQKIEYLLTAARQAVEKEAIETVRGDLSTLRDKQGALDKARTDVGQAIQTIQQYLAEIEAGGKPPEGFTEDELKDRLGTRMEEARALEKEEAELRERMQQKEDLLAKGDIPPQGPTVHTQELEALKELKARIDKLDARLK
jgi:hypothetical protein